MKKALVLWMMWIASAAWAQEPPLIDLAAEVQPAVVNEQANEAEPETLTPEQTTESEAKQDDEAAKAKQKTQQAEMESAKPAEWGYAGEIAPRYWGRLDVRYALCDAGKTQSPINLVDKQAVNTRGLPGLDIAYREVPLRLKLTEHDLIGEYPLGSYIMLGDERYEFTHYQFKTPSEHHIGGFAYPMEIQLYHRDGEGRQVVMSVIVQEGEANETLQTILNNAPKDKNLLQVFEKLDFNPAKFLPSKKEFYRYLGSNTQPPCEQGVVWLVFKQPIQASIGQLIKMHDLVGDNVRPLQPLNGRIPLKSWMSERTDEPRVGSGYYFDY